MRPMIKLPSVANAVAGAKAVVTVPMGRTYERIQFVCTGTALAATMINRINVVLDGKIVQTYKNLQRLIDINSYYNRSADTISDFVLHFFRAEMADLVMRRMPGIGTADLSTFTIELDIDATAPGDFTMECYAEVSENQPSSVFFKVREYPINSAVAGPVEVDRLPKGPFYSVLHCFKSDVSYVEMVADQFKFVDSSKSVLERWEKEASPEKRVPVTASCTHIDFIRDGDIAQSLKTEGLNDLRLTLTLDTAGSCDLVAETLDTLKGV